MQAEVAGGGGTGAITHAESVLEDDVGIGLHDGAGGSLGVRPLVGHTGGIGARAEFAVARHPAEGGYDAAIGEHGVEAKDNEIVGGAGEAEKKHRGEGAFLAAGEKRKVQAGVAGKQVGRPQQEDELGYEEAAPAQIVIADGGTQEGTDQGAGGCHHEKGKFLALERLIGGAAELPFISGGEQKKAELQKIIERQQRAVIEDEPPRVIEAAGWEYVGKKEGSNGKGDDRKPEPGSPGPESSRR